MSVSKGKTCVRLNIDVHGRGWTDEEAVIIFSCHRNTVANLRQRLVAEGLKTTEVLTSAFS